MNSKDLLELQTKRGARTGEVSDKNKRTLDEVVDNCRNQLELRSSEYRDLKPSEKVSAIKSIILDYVMTEKPLVEGFVSNDNVPDTVKLAGELIEAITGYDFLTQAMEDESINEIRANGKWIKIEQHGKIKDLTDKDGNILSFESPTQQEIIMKKLMGNVRCTPANALANAQTIEGYRIATVHKSALSRDPKNPDEDLYNAFVLRKFKDVKYSLGEIVQKGTMSDDMARLLVCAALGGATVVTVGPTSSGKTTTNNAYLNSIPEDLRTIIIQNPSEIDARKRDETGRIVNDILHIEAVSKENPKPSDPTPENCMDQSLRLSPSFFCFGELRSDVEFTYAMKMLLAGHPMNATYHAFSAENALRRFMIAYSSSSGLPADLALMTITEHIDFVIYQKLMRDGSRKVIDISEVIGVDPENRMKPITKSIFRFKKTDVKYDEMGRVEKIIGHHERVGAISQRTIDKFDLEAIKREKYDFLTKEPSVGKRECTYNGTDIEKYGE